KIITHTVVGSILGLLLIYPFLLFLDDQVLTTNLYVFLILVLATISFCFSYLPHYKLYVFNHDRDLLKASILGAVSNLLFNFALVPSYGVMGAAYAQLAGMLVLLFAK